MNGTFFNEMFDSACKSEMANDARVYACLAVRGVPYSYGTNQKKSHPFQKRFGRIDECIYLHAEVDAIKNALKIHSVKEIEKSDIYIMRVKRTGKGKPFIPGLAKPCVGCMRAIVTFGINNCFYSSEDKYVWSCL